MRHLVKWDPNGFSAIFRCTSSKYAHDFITKGAIKFNTPDSWVREAMKNGEGRGDLLEGSIAGCHMSDLSYLIELDKKYPLSNTIRFPVNDIIYFKRKKTMKIPCFCYYELKNSMFNCPNDTGIHTQKM